MQSTEELVNAAKEGDVAAFTALVRRYERTVVLTAWPIAGDFHSAQDAAQDAFVIAYRELPQLRHASTFGPWLLRIVKREAARMRKRLSREAGDSGALAEMVPAHGSWWEEFQDIVPQLAQLPDQERVVVSLRYLDGLSVREVALATGRPIGTVTKQLSRAIQRLRSLLIEVER